MFQDFRVNVKNFILTRWLWIIPALGILIIIKVYIENRSLFLDELNLVRNIIESGYLNLTSPLEYGQYAPIGFLYLIKSASLIMGQFEWVYRFFPAIAGILSIILFSTYLFSMGRFQNAIYVLLLFCFSFPIMRHSTEVKQYATDLLISITALWLTSKNKPDERSTYYIWMAFGCVGIWFSMPLAFILFGIGLYLLYDAAKHKRAIWLPVLTIFLWLISFGLVYWLQLSQAISSDYLRQYHQDHFLQFSWNRMTYNQITGIFRNLSCKSGISISFTMFFFILGIIYAFRQQFKLLLIWLLPILAMLAASYFKQYSIIERLMLFSFPFFYCLIWFGFEKTIALFPGYRKSVRIIFHLWAVLAVVTSLVQRSSLPFLLKPFIFEEGRELWMQLAEKSDGETLLLTHNAEPTYIFYSKYAANRINGNFSDIIYLSWDSNISAVCDSIGIDSTPFWIMDVHTFGWEWENLNQHIHQCGKIEDHIQTTEARAWRLISGHSSGKMSKPSNK